MRNPINTALAERVRNLPPYLFDRIDRLQTEAINNNVDVIDLSIGDPDIPTPPVIVEALKRAAENPEHHRYPSYRGMASFRGAVSAWYKRRFGVDIDPNVEALSLIGSKEGVGHLPLAFVNPGDVVLCPCPGYPVYSIGTLFAQGQPYFMPLKEENDYFPDFAAIPQDILKRARLMFLNYPNNPTSAATGRENFLRAIELAHQHNIIICHDAAYTETYFDGKRPLSFMEIDGAREVAIELHSLSKTYNMTGWRVGFAVGNRELVQGLGKIKTNLDSGVFQAIQEAAIVALEMSDDQLAYIRDTYQERRDCMYDGLRGLGLSVKKPEATFYLWARVPEKFASEAFSVHLLEKSGVLATPGNGFGVNGEGYIRFALTKSVERIKEAIERMRLVI
ncbi:LL-diaminopimelate aminotransferase [Candidatus Magnetobacterium casense]|uniref:LL-diaminopimelate aminotransferase n=1 Tax=Candidatus Magnetobacterium casense TaxID=1455061 RepID=A0ABS6S0J5_9BACT|nr:LL-diaminopimelate aminotransferase [Candidatus Magnetobacterium casensis]MBV6341913.1 LL-diaminopimelate aminotransferase [Candidatus Magnetobacterium casensis]